MDSARIVNIVPGTNWNLSGNDNLESLFVMKPGNQWIEESKTKPIPRMLFGELWHEGELCFLFADTNQGKSIIAVQIADSISKGKPIPGFKMEAQQQPVLYLDFELSAKQFEGRYSIKNSDATCYEDHYRFSDDFIRIELNPQYDIPEGINYETFLRESLERAIEDSGAKVIIIDNLTYLKNELERSDKAAPLVKDL